MDSDEKIIQVWLESKESASRLDIFEYGPLKKLEMLVLEEFFVKRDGNGDIFHLDQG